MSIRASLIVAAAAVRYALNAILSSLFELALPLWPSALPDDDKSIEVVGGSTKRLFVSTGLM